MKAPLMTVIDDGKVAGFILSRGRQGFEAFTADERSLGTHETADRAAEVAREHHHKETNHD
jgi:hypothetical protein